MAQILIDQEQETADQWSYRVRVEQGGQHHSFHVTLSFADYNLWCGGRVAPEKVVEGLFRFLLEREPVTSILGKFDCAVVRRYFPEVDQKLPEMI